MNIVLSANWLTKTEGCQTLINRKSPMLQLSAAWVIPLKGEF
nr:MAG TPA: hypothetical protein [Bacteriophage sp.]